MQQFCKFFLVIVQKPSHVLIISFKQIFHKFTFNQKLKTALREFYCAKCKQKHTNYPTCLGKIS